MNIRRRKNIILTLDEKRKFVNLISLLTKIDNPPSKVLQRIKTPTAKKPAHQQKEKTGFGSWLKILERYGANWLFDQLVPCA